MLERSQLQGFAWGLAMLGTSWLWPQGPVTQSISRPQKAHLLAHKLFCGYKSHGEVCVWRLCWPGRAGNRVSGHTLSSDICCSLVHCLCLVIPLLHQSCSWGMFPCGSKKLELTRSEDGVLSLYSCYLCWWRNIQAVPGGPWAEDVLWRPTPLLFWLFFPRRKRRKGAQTAATQVRNKQGNNAVGMLMAINVC